MLDTQIYDLVVTTPGMIQQLNTLTDNGTIEILTTFVQEEELALISDSEKRIKVLGIKRTKVPPAAGPWGQTPWGEFPWGADGTEAGLPIRKIISLEGKHWRDALIACTASAEAGVLVTEDLRLRKRIAKVGARCVVWDFCRFKDYAVQLLGE